ncbi:TetR/AcrR family transcriptional regulator [Novosphingobium colocasiae]|nr:TetR/AcrR family transcriptional regulator [Novosphingobium colocasiae]
MTLIESGNKMAARLSVVDGAKGPGRNRDAKQERSRRRRQVLSEVVMQLVREKGFAGISINEVAERASISVGGLYRHIATKSDLLELVCDEINLGLLEEMKEAAAAQAGVSAKLEAAVRTYWMRHWECSAAILVAYREYPSFSEEAQQRYREEERRLAEYLGDLIRAGTILGEFREVDDRVLAYEIILLSHMRALKGYAFKDRERDDVFAEQLDLILSRLLPAAE